jgi:hypothetical protein
MSLGMWIIETVQGKVPPLDPPLPRATVVTASQHARAVLALRQHAEEIARGALTLQPARSVLGASGRGAEMRVVLLWRSVWIAALGFIPGAPPAFRVGVANGP